MLKTRLVACSKFVNCSSRESQYDWGAMCDPLFMQRLFTLTMTQIFDMNSKKFKESGHELDLNLSIISH